jgi:HSP20 family protein
MALMQRHRSEQSSELANRQQQGAVPLSQVMQRLFQDSVLLPSMFDGFGGAAGTAGTNLWETGDSYTIQAAMPGMRADSIQVTVEQEVLTVRGASGLQAPEQARPIWQSFGGEAAYRIQLPGEVESGQAEASYEQGILTVRLPKAAHAQAHTIAVRAT